MPPRSTVTRMRAAPENAVIAGFPQNAFESALIHAKQVGTRAAIGWSATISRGSEGSRSGWARVYSRRFAKRELVLPVAGENGDLPDRKSTRLNSSHLVISYAVFCLKKKKY